MTSVPPMAATRLVRILLAAAVLATLGFGTAWSAPTAVRAALPELTITGDATYVVDPDAARVRVTVDLTATNHKADTATRRYWFEDAFLGVLPGTEGHAVTAAGASPSVRVSSRAADYTLLRIAFGRRLYSGQSMDLRLTFDLPDPGGAASREVRVGQALVTFPVWAFATDATPGGSVTVVFPEGFTVEVVAGSLEGPVPGVDGSQVLRSGTLAEPLEFFAYVVADRPGAYTSRLIEPEVRGVAVPITLEGWTDDQAWTDRVDDLLTRGLPVLGDEIGLAYPPADDPLVVRESVSRTLGGYAGIFSPAAGRIDVDYAAGPYVILHEAAHLWFNGSFLAERWANEGFASYYASVAAPTLEVEAVPDRLTPELEAARIPLNAWGAVGAEDDATEDFGYAASLALAEAIAQRAGPDGLRRVWAAIEAGEAAYQPRHETGPPATTGAVPDWRALLDMLEERTDATYADLWASWVVRPTEADRLTARGTARAVYEEAADLAADWELPASIRTALAAWRFEEATGLAAQAEAVLAQRAEIETRAAALGLEPPDALRDAFEGDAGLRAAAAEAGAELTALGAIETATEARRAEPTIVEWIGLVGEEPDADLAAAGQAFEAADPTTAVAAADAARASWEGADAVGTRRALSGLGVLLLVLLVAGLLVARLRSWRRSRRIASSAEPAVVEGP